VGDSERVWTECPEGVNIICPFKLSFDHVPSLQIFGAIVKVSADTFRT
jgi:hypothetical protein